MLFVMKMMMTRKYSQQSISMMKKILTVIDSRILGFVVVLITAYLKVSSLLN